MELSILERKEIYSRAAFQQLESKMMDIFGVGVWPGLKGVGRVEVTEDDVLHACDGLVNTIWETATVQYAVLKKTNFTEVVDPDTIVGISQLSFFKDTMGWCLITDIAIVPE